MTLRLAVALPSLPADAPVRLALESTVVALAGRGHTVETFAEHDRLDDGPVGGEPAAGGAGGNGDLPLFHYLRLPGRHRAAPFDAALHPFGRDAHLYQGVHWCTHALPGLLWALDSGLHHFVLGDLGPRGLWSAYRRALAADQRAPDAGALVDVVAAGWGTGLLFRRHDLLGWLAGDQIRVAAASVPLAGELRESLPGRDVGTAPLPAPPTATELPDASFDPVTWERWDARAPRVLVASLELASPATAFRALGAVRELCPGAELRVCAPGILVPGLLGPAASRLGLDGAVEWVTDAGPARIRRQLDEADLVAWLRADPVAEDRLWQLEALAAGKPVLVLQAPHHDDLTPGAVIPVDPGRGLATGVRRALEQLVDDEELRRAVGEAARLLAAAAPTPRDAARSLEAQLEMTAAAEAPRLRDVSASTWEAVGREILDRTVPAGAPPAARRAVAAALPLPRGDGP